MSQSPDNPTQDVTNRLTGAVSGVVVQAGVIHGDVHVRPVNPRPWLPWLILGTVLAAFAALAVVFTVNNTIAGQPVESSTYIPPVESSTFTLSGTLTLNPSSSGQRSGNQVIASTAQGCQGTGNYSDLSAGTAVIVKDPEGRQIAVGALQAGHLADGNSNSCVMTFAVPGVPGGVASYSVTISHRGTQVVTLDKAHAGVTLLCIPCG